MHIQYKDILFRDDTDFLTFHRSITPEITLSCQIVFEEKKMLDYQKDIFEEFLGTIVDTLSIEGVAFSEAKKAFEKGLQDVNLKIQVFCEKMGEEIPYPIHGVMQLVFGYEYLSSLIGSGGLLILRKERLHYIVSNLPQEGRMISQFSEVIEGEVALGDKIITCGFPVETYLDREDILTIIGTTQSEGIGLLDGFTELLQLRIDSKDIRFMTQIDIESSLQHTQKKLQRGFDVPYKKLVDFVGGQERLQSIGVYLGLGFITLALLYGLIGSFNKANDATFVNEQGGVVIDVTIEDIQKDIAMFQKIDPSSDQKIMKYNDIITKLDILDDNNKWTFDVAELRKILETEYYKGFNIILVNNDSFFKEPVYKFTQQEKNTFAEPKQLFFNDTLSISGREGVLLGAINDQLRGTLISTAIGQKMGACSFNLLRNGLYCNTTDNEIFNVVKSGLQPVSTSSGLFPGSISGIDRFGSSNMYLLTNDSTLNQAGIHVVRYTNQLGSQEQFGDGTQYALAEGDTTFAGSGLSSFSIDGTFLVWSPVSKQLHQLRRADASSNLQHRPVPMIGGDTVEPYSASTKVLASADSRFVYLFDKQNQSFTVYRSVPYKTNDANTYTYELAYFFRVKFALSDFDIVDVFVDEGEKSRLLVLTTDGVFAMKLHEYIDQYIISESEE